MSIILLQIETPPAEFTSYLLWNIGILVSALAGMFALLKSNFDQRLKDKDDVIKAKELELSTLRNQYDEIVKEIRQTNQLADGVIQMLRDGKQ